MSFNASALHDIHQANVNFGMSLGNLWLENINRTRALALKEADECAASVQKTVAAIAGAKDLTAVAPLQAELMRQQMEQSGNFWRTFLAETQGNQKAVLDDFRNAVQSWQENCSQALGHIADGTPMASICQQIVGATGMAYQPLSIATQQMFDLAKATFDSLQSSSSFKTPPPPPAKSRAG